MLTLSLKKQVKQVLLNIENKFDLDQKMQFVMKPLEQKKMS